MSQPFISLVTPDSQEITIDVIPPEAMQALYDTIRTILEGQKECLDTYQEQEELETAAEIERSEMAADEEPPERPHDN